jgi:hypothetical protein
MTTVVLATVRMLQFLDTGGHFWVYMQYAEGLRRLGCEVYVFDTASTRTGGASTSSTIAWRGTGCATT